MRANTPGVHKNDTEAHFERIPKKDTLVCFTKLKNLEPKDFNKLPNQNVCSQTLSKFARFPESGDKFANMASLHRSVNARGVDFSTESFCDSYTSKVVPSISGGRAWKSVNNKCLCELPMTFLWNDWWQTSDHGRTQGGLGWKPPLEHDLLQNFITCAKEINCFRILFAC